MSPETRAVLACAGLAIAFVVTGLLLPDKSQTREVLRLRLPFRREGTSVMEEEVVERGYLVWYGAGLPKLEWRRVHS